MAAQLPRSLKEATTWVRSRKWKQAMQLVAKLPSSLVDAQVYTAIIGCREAPPRQAMAVLRTMARVRVKPTEVTYGAAIAHSDLAGGQELLGAMPHDIPRSGPLLALFKVCKERKSAADALALLDKYKSDLEEAHYNVAIASCAQDKKWQEALAVFAQVAEPSVQTHNSLLGAYAKARLWGRALQLLDELVSKGLANNVTFNTAIHACEAAGRWEEALRLGDRMDPVSRDESSFGSLIAACEKGKQWEKALLLLDDMEAARVSSLICFNSAISACAQGQQWEHAVRLLGQLENTPGLDPDTISYNACLTACEKVRRWADALRLLDRMGAKRVPKDTITFNAAISSLEKGRQWEKAWALFHESSVEPTDVTIGAVCAALATEGQWEKAVELVEHPLANEKAFSATISACGRAKQWEVATALLKKMAARGIEPDSITYNAAARACELGKSPPEVAEKVASKSGDSVGMSSLVRMDIIKEAQAAAVKWARGGDPDFVQEPHHAVHLAQALGKHAPEEFVTKVRGWVLDKTVTSLREEDIEALRRFGLPNLGPFTREALDALGFHDFDATEARRQVQERGAPRKSEDVRAFEVMAHVKCAALETVKTYGTHSRSEVLPSIYLHHDRSGHAERQALLQLDELGVEGKVELYITHRPCVSCISAMVAFRSRSTKRILKVAYDELDCD